CFVCLCFFFFQAEDGIRDATVTGVQTCALPISHRTRQQRRVWRPAATPDHRAPARRSARRRPAARQLRRQGHADRQGGRRRRGRSEERRVGKEGRSRRSREREKEKKRIETATEQ